jgi:hypothetical protein
MSSSDPEITRTEDLQTVLSRISFAPSCLDMGWEFDVEELPCTAAGAAAVRDHAACTTCGGARKRGWLVSTTFQRPDTQTGEIARGRGRKEFIAIGATLSSVVKTAWLLCRLIVEHELHEAFLFDGKRVFDPHKTVDELTPIARCRRAKAG